MKPLPSPKSRRRKAIPVREAVASASVALAVLTASLFAPIAGSVPIGDTQAVHLAPVTTYAQDVHQDKSFDEAILPLIGFLRSAIGTVYGAAPDRGQSNKSLSAGVTRAFDSTSLDGDILPTGSGVPLYLDSSVSLTTYNGQSRFAGFLDDGVTANAAYGPLKNLTQLHNLTRNISANTVAEHSVVYGKRGQSYTGFFYFWGRNGTTDYCDFTLCSWGDPLLARPKLLYNELDISGSVGFLSAIFLRLSSGTTNTKGFKAYNWDFDGQNITGISYTSLTGGTPTVGDTVTVTGSGATGTIIMTPVNGPGYFVMQGLIATATNTTNNGAFAAWSQTPISNNAPFSAITGSSGWSATVTNGNAGVTGYTPLVAFNQPGDNSEIQNCSFSNFTGNGISPIGNNYLIQNVVLTDCLNMWQKGSACGGNGAGVIYRHITIIRGGRDRTFAHGMYFIGTSATSVLANIYCYRCADNAITLHGLSSDTAITDCFAEECGNGFGMGPGSFGTNETATNLTLDRCIALNCGQVTPYNTQGGNAFGFACQVNGFMRNCLAIGNAGFALNVGQFTGTGANLCTQNTNFQALNNTFYGNTTGALVNLTEGSSAFPSISFTVQNNIIVNTSATGLTIDRRTGDTIPDASITLDNNLHWMPNKVASPSSGTLVTWKGTSYTMAAFLAAIGKETQQAYADPLFSNPGTTAIGSAPYRQLSSLFQQAPAGKVVGSNVSITTDFRKLNRATANNVGCYA